MSLLAAETLAIVSGIAGFVISLIIVFGFINPFLRNRGFRLWIRVFTGFISACIICSGIIILIAYLAGSY